MDTVVFLPTSPRGCQKACNRPGEVEIGLVEALQAFPPGIDARASEKLDQDHGRGCGCSSFMHSLGAIADSSFYDIL